MSNGDVIYIILPIRSHLGLACVASVPVRGERNSSRAKNEARAKRWKEGGGEGERRERLPANP